MTETYNIVRLVSQSGIQSVFYKVKSWNVKEVLDQLHKNGLKLKDFRYFWFETRKRILNRDTQYELLYTETKTIRSSSSYYINGYTQTLDDIIAKNDVWLINKMREKGWQTIVTSIDPNENWYYGFKNGDFLVDLNGNIIEGD